MWNKTFSPDSRIMYLAYQGANTGSQTYQFQLQKDQLNITVTPEPATMSLLTLGGMVALLRKRR